jgi:putative SOS response-associated peptidase YedK
MRLISRPWVLKGPPIKARGATPGMHQKQNRVLQGRLMLGGAHRCREVRTQPRAVRHMKRPYRTRPTGNTLPRGSIPRFDDPSRQDEEDAATLSNNQSPDFAFRLTCARVRARTMCNAYTIRPKGSRAAFDEAVSAAAARLKRPLVRRSDPGVVVVMRDGVLVPELMRWGFARGKFNSINNARSENLTKSLWTRPLQESRCLVPMTTFYEWQELPGQSKQPYEFKHPSGDWLLIAGLYEISDSHGPCYATLTTAPSAQVEPIHDRLLAIMDWDRAQAFLHGEDTAFQPYRGPLDIQPCISPLIAKKPKDSDQGHLF